MFRGDLLRCSVETASDRNWRSHGRDSSAGVQSNARAMHMYMHVKQKRQPFRLAAQPACASVQSSCDPPLRLKLYLPRIQLYAAGSNLNNHASHAPSRFPYSLSQIALLRARAAHVGITML